MYAENMVLQSPGVFWKDDTVDESPGVEDKLGNTDLTEVVRTHITGACLAFVSSSCKGK